MSIKCLTQIEKERLLLTCAPIYELPSDISAMPISEFLFTLHRVWWNIPELFCTNVYLTCVQNVQAVWSTFHSILTPYTKMDKTYWA